MWVHNKCSLVSETQYENIQNSNSSWICPKCDFFNFSDSFFSNIMSHLDEHKLLSDRQHAFRKSHSCETQLATVIDDWAKS